MENGPDFWYAVALAVSGFTAYLLKRAHGDHDARIKDLEDERVEIGLSLEALRQQIERYSANLESEKGTRQRENTRINEKLDRILERRYHDRGRPE